MLEVGSWNWARRRTWRPLQLSYDGYERWGIIRFQNSCGLSQVVMCFYIFNSRAHDRCSLDTLASLLDWTDSKIKHWVCNHMHSFLLTPSNCLMVQSPRKRAWDVHCSLAPCSESHTFHEELTPISEFLLDWDVPWVFLAWLLGSFSNAFQDADGHI